MAPSATTCSYRIESSTCGCSGRPGAAGGLRGHQRSPGGLTGLLAGRTGRPADDYQLELIAFVLAAVLFTASRRWVADQGATPLAALVDQALTTVEPLLATLEDPTRTLP